MDGLAAGGESNMEAGVQVREAKVATKSQKVERGAQVITIQ